MRNPWFSLTDTGSCAPLLAMVQTISVQVFRSLFALTVAAALVAGGSAARAEPAAAGGGETGDELAEARAARARGDDARAAGLAAAVVEGLEGAERGRALLLGGLALEAGGRHEAAERALAEAAALLPHLADRIALARGAALLALGRYAEAADAFAAARNAAAVESVAMHAEVGQVRAMLAGGLKNAPQRAAQVLRRYPELPERGDVDLAVARYHEALGRQGPAVAAYRALFLEQPHTSAGAVAAERLEDLARSGRRFPRISQYDHLGRVRRLVSEREYEAAERELAELLPDAEGELRNLAQLELAIVALRRGEPDRARQLLDDLHRVGGPVGLWIERCELGRGETQGAVRRVLRGAAASKRTPPATLIRLAEIHLEAGEYERARAVLSFVKMSRAPGFMATWLPWIAFKRGEYDAAIAGLARLPEESWSRGRRHYWVGRAHQLAGRPCPARDAFESAVRADPHGYYALWARKRLGELRDQVVASPGPLRCPAPTPEDPAATVPWSAPDPLMLWGLPPRAPEPTAAEGLAAFDALIATHGKGLPWLLRARDLWLAGDVDGSGDELRQVLWMTRGELPPTIGLPRLWGGRATVKNLGRRARLTDAELGLYMTAARAVGEHGLAIQADRPSRGALEPWHPLAFEPLVRAEAESAGLEPELLWSIMRIESTFNRHAISPAHALGLMQILPRTGRLIARQSGATGFEVADLLTPRRGLDFAAWYLRALSDRFHGQAPLVIAAYNGGPHNVAHWITRRADAGSPLPLDEFVEEIPFEETYRYVHRVLASLAVYRALGGLPPPELPDLVDRDVTAGVRF